MALTAKQESKFLESSLFVGCEKDSLRGLAQIVMPHSLFKGEVLRVTREQEAVGFLLSGKLEICNLHGVLYYNICPGECVGMEDLFSEVAPVVECCVCAKTNSMLTFLDRKSVV